MRREALVYEFSVPTDAEIYDVARVFSNEMHKSLDGDDPFVDVTFDRSPKPHHAPSMMRVVCESRVPLDGDVKRSVDGAGLRTSNRLFAGERLSDYTRDRRDDGQPECWLRDTDA